MLRPHSLLCVASWQVTKLEKENVSSNVFLVIIMLHNFVLLAVV